MEMIDIPAAKGVQIQVREDGKVVWVNVDGLCVLRCNNIEVLDVEDNRPDLCAGCGHQKCTC
jgi:hypothetical protein